MYICACIYVHIVFGAPSISDLPQVSRLLVGLVACGKPGEAEGRIDPLRRIWCRPRRSDGVYSPKGPKYLTIGYLAFPYFRIITMVFGRYLVVGTWTLRVSSTWISKVPNYDPRSQNRDYVRSPKCPKQWPKIPK